MELLSTVMIRHTSGRALLVKVMTTYTIAIHQNRKSLSLVGCRSGIVKWLREQKLTRSSMTGRCVSVCNVPLLWEREHVCACECCIVLFPCGITGYLRTCIDSQWMMNYQVWQSCRTLRETSGPMLLKNKLKNWIKKKGLKHQEM